MPNLTIPRRELVGRVAELAGEAASAAAPEWTVVLEGLLHAAAFLAAEHNVSPDAFARNAAQIAADQAAARPRVRPAVVLPPREFDAVLEDARKGGAGWKGFRS